MGPSSSNGAVKPRGKSFVFSLPWPIHGCDHQLLVLWRPMLTCAAFKTAVCTPLRAPRGGPARPQRASRLHTQALLGKLFGGSQVCSSW